MAVVENPFAGVDAEDFSDFPHAATNLGPDLAAELVSMLPNLPVAYGKAALVGAPGAKEQGAAILQPKLDAPAHDAIGSGTTEREIHLRNGSNLFRRTEPPLFEQ